MFHCDGMAAWLFTKKLWGHVYVEHLVDIFFSSWKYSATRCDLFQRLEPTKRHEDRPRMHAMVVNLCVVETCISWAWIKYFYYDNLDFKWNFWHFFWKFLLAFVCYCFCLHSHFSAVLPASWVLAKFSYFWNKTYQIPCILI